MSRLRERCPSASTDVPVAVRKRKLRPPSRSEDVTQWRRGQAREFRVFPAGQIVFSESLLNIATFTLTVNIDFQLFFWLGGLCAKQEQKQQLLQKEAIRSKDSFAFLGWSRVALVLPLFKLPHVPFD